MARFLRLWKYRLIVIWRHLLLWLEQKLDQRERDWIKRKVVRCGEFDPTFNLDHVLLLKMTPEEQALYMKDIERWRWRVHNLDLELKNKSRL